VPDISRNIRFVDTIFSNSLTPWFLKKDVAEWRTKTVLRMTPFLIIMINSN
jgi:hypothetical protein